jgi:two-component sensor histidine kinase
MTKRLILIALLLNCFAGLKAQVHLPEKPAELFPLIKKSAPDTNRIALLNKLGGYYIFKPGNFKYDLDSALNYLNQALVLSEKLHSIKWENETLKLKGDCYLEGEDLPHGKACFKQVTDYYHRIGNISEEADTWNRLGRCITSGHFSEREICFTKALSLYKGLKVHDRIKETGVLKRLADVHLNAGKLDLAENELYRVLRTYQAIGYKDLQYTYHLLSELYRLKGFPNKELWSNQECIKFLKKSDDTAGLVNIYYRIGIIYEGLGFIDKSIIYFKLAIGLSERSEPSIFAHSMFLCDLSTALTKQGKVQTAISLLLKDFRRPSLRNTFQRSFLEEGLGNCYSALKEYSKAEKYYLDMLSDYKAEQNGASQVDFLSREILISELYIAMKRYSKVVTYLNEIDIAPSGIFSAVDLGRIQLLHFKIDSAKGNYFSALNHYQAYKTLRDSIYNDTKNKQLQELEISYETAEKERSIAALQNREKVQRAELKRANTQKDLTSIGTVLVLIIAGLAYYGFRQKRRSNLHLQAHQKEIDLKNESLEGLNFKQQLLLIEKEWLLKEIHHRVKNNLQTTISLLNMQSAYLSNDEALAAIRNSQRRMQAMSLIHQKLYQSETMTHVEMSEYVAEMVSYLKESFQGTKNIDFVLRIHSVMLEVTQAIPLGLIINEAVTNAIKYAFPDEQKGKISIVLKKDIGLLFHLIIADNGIGMPLDFEVNKKHNSLGLNLIRGLTDQISGELNIKNDNGTILIITFKDNGVFEEKEFENIVQED